MRKSLIIPLLSVLLLSISAVLQAQDAGTRAAYTRGGWVGAKYVGIGKAAEVIADDVFAIYWNPAGLCELKTREGLSSDEVRKEVEKGEIEKISEQDLIKFSEEGTTRPFVQVGVSAAALDIEREAGFSGVAFTMFKGIAGAGVYLIQSRDIEARDESGNLTGSLNYQASAGYLSYGWSAGIASLGVSLKGLREQIGESVYYGGGADFGVNVDVLPVIRVGFVVQDIGTSMYQDNAVGRFWEKMDFGYPSMKLGVSLTNGRDFTIALSGVKRLEQEKYEVNAGIMYNLSRVLTLSLGLNDSNFSSGIMLEFWNMSIGYAFAIDKINLGYNNIVSLTLVL